MGKVGRIEKGYFWGDLYASNCMGPSMKLTFCTSLLSRIATCRACLWKQQQICCPWDMGDYAKSRYH